MEQQAVRLLIQQKPKDGRLPHDSIERIWEGPGREDKTSPAATRAKAKFLYIISREWPELYRRIAAEFADLSNVTVILDRRVNPGTHVNERRVLTVHEDLEALGWAIVPVVAG